jgi:hypothetical protein
MSIQLSTTTGRIGTDAECRCDTIQNRPQYVTLEFQGRDRLTLRFHRATVLQGGAGKRNPGNIRPPNSFTTATIDQCHWLATQFTTIAPPGCRLARELSRLLDSVNLPLNNACLFLAIISRKGSAFAADTFLHKNGLFPKVLHSLPFHRLGPIAMAQHAFLLHDVQLTGLRLKLPIVQRKA